MSKLRTKRLVKSALSLFLAGVLVLGDAGVPGQFGPTVVQAAEESGTQITSLSYYDAANPRTSISGTGAKTADVGFVLPLFNGKPSTELPLTQVQDDLTLYVKQSVRTGGEWVDIDDLDYFQFNVTWGWEHQVWSDTAEGWIAWFKIDETTELKFQSNSDPSVSLEYVLGFNKLDSYGLTSLAAKNAPINASATGKAGISKVDNFIYNGNASIVYSQIEDDFNEDNTEILVKRDSEADFQPLFNNLAGGWQYDGNFGVYTEGGGGWWFTQLEEGITVRFHSTENKFADVDIRINYTASDRATYTLAAVDGKTEFRADVTGTDAVIGMCLPRIGGTEVRRSDLDKFKYEIYDEGEWKPLGDVWLYRENGYSKLTDRVQWGYSVNDLYELWFKPVKDDARLRISYPVDGQPGGDTSSNYVEYTFIGNPEAEIPDVSDLGNIVVDNADTEGDVYSVPDIDGWQLIWNDEFNGNAVDSSKWWNQTGYLLDETDYTTYGWGNKELEHYTDSEENTSVKDGKLNITLLKDEKEFEDTQGRKAIAQYSSGKLLSQNKFAVKYGRIDFRAKLPEGTGVWPALWMMPNENTYGTWARSGELDVMEAKGRVPDTVYGTLHYGDAWPGDKEDGLDFSFKREGIDSDITDWHVYSAVWEEDNIKIYCDGQCYYKGTNEIWYSSGARDNQNAPFDIQYYLIINLAAGGYFDGLNAPAADVTRKDMYVDYVRVYQRTAGEGEPDEDGDGLYGDFYMAQQIPLENFSLDKASVAIPVGTSEKITPSFEPFNATDKAVVWSSSDETIATVTGGTVNGLKPGTATITAVAGGGDFERICEVTVTGGEVENITLNEEELTLLEGGKVRLTATVTPEDSNQNVVWTSSDTSVATVDANGNVTAVKAGDATITATAEGDASKSATCAVTVEEKPPVSVTGVLIKNQNDESGEVSLKVGEKATLTAVVAPSDAANKNVTWASGDNAIVTVLNGVVTAVAEGHTTVTVTTEDGNKTDTWNVIVTKNVVTERSDYGIERQGNDIVFYYKTAGKPVGFYKKLSSADEEVVDSAVGAAPDSQIRQNGDYYECVIPDAGLNEDDYYACYFNFTSNNKLIYRVGDIPRVDDGDNTPVSVTGVTLNKTELNLLKGETLTLRATVEPFDADDRSVTWSSDNEGAVEVDQNGKLTAKAVGTATITATTTDGDYTATCSVTVGNTYKVTFRDGGNVVDTLSLKSDETVTKPADPEKPGYTFGGWLLGEVAYVFGSEVTGDLVLDASWNPILVNRIQMSENLTLELGKDTTLTTTVTPGDALSTGITWSSDDPGIASVDEETGKITAVAVGTTTINATAADGSGVTAQCSVTVTEAAVHKSIFTIDFVVNGETTSVKVEEGSRVARPADPTRDGYNFDGWFAGTALYNFDSEVTQSFVLTAQFTKIEDENENPGGGDNQNPGSDATDNGNNDNTDNSNNNNNKDNSGSNQNEDKSDNDQQIKVTGIKIKGISKKIAAGKKITLSAEVKPADAANKTVTWKSSNTRWATVTKKGVVKTKKAGAGKKVTITATANDGSGKKATYKITIMKKPVKKIKLKASGTNVKVGKSVNVKATVTPSSKKTTNTTLTWKSSNTKWATVTNKGVVKTKKAGKGKTVTIIATATDGSKKKAKIKIKIK